MNKIETVDYSNWIPYDGFSPGSGRSEKQWLQSRDGEIGLFKFPKVNPATSTISTEYVSEHLAHRIGDILGIETADVELGFYNGRIGSMSYLINREDEAVVEGAVFITGLHPDYDLELMRETESGRYYCFDQFLEITTEEYFVGKWIEMMLFDYLTGNTDRHQNNWAFLIKLRNKEKENLRYRFCPLYDNGSSLCSYVNESDIDAFLGRDKNRFDALVDRKSRSMIRIDGFNKTKPTHREVIEYLVQRYPYAFTFSRDIIERMSDKVITCLVGQYSEILTENRIELIKKFLLTKVQMLNDILEGYKG